MTDMNEIMARWAERNRLLQQANEVNQKTIFKALAALAIENVVVTFDGCGDSGQIDDLTVNGGKGVLSGEVTIEIVPFTGTDREQRTCGLREAVEDLCYALLEAEHDGWEINDGAFGEIVFDVAPRTVTLDCNLRYTSHETFQHVFESEV